MEKENTNFGLIGGALERTKAYHNSNIIAKYDGILVPDTQQTLDHFAKKHNFEFGKDTDTLEDDRLLKYTVQKMNPTKKLDEFSDPTQIYIITDAAGFDIGTYDMSTGEFKLSPDIIEFNKKMIEKCGASELKEDFEEPNLEKVIEKLAKGESLVLANEEQVKDERLKVARENFKNAGQDFELEENERDLSEEEKALDTLPEGAKSQVLNLKDEIGENIEIKDILIVNSPTSITDELGGEANGIKSNGGPVVMIRAASKGADKLSDDMYVFQDDALLPIDQEREERFGTLMNEHQGEGVVGELQDTEKEKVKDAIAELIEQRNVEVERMKAENPEADIYELKENEVQINLKLLGSVQSYMKETGYEPDEEIKQVVDNIQCEATPDRMDDLDKAQEDVIDGMATVAGATATVAGRLATSILTDDEQEEENDDHMMNRWDSANPYMHK